MPDAMSSPGPAQQNSLPSQFEARCNCGEPIRFTSFRMEEWRATCFRVRHRDRYAERVVGDIALDTDHVTATCRLLAQEVAQHCTQMANTNPRNPFNRRSLNLESSVRLISREIIVESYGYTRHRFTYRAPRSAWNRIDQMFRVGEPITVAGHHYVVTDIYMSDNGGGIADINVQVDAQDFASVLAAAQGQPAPPTPPAAFDKFEVDAASATPAPKPSINKPGIRKFLT